MKYLIFVVLLVAAAILSIQITKPFYGYHDWNGITYGQIARNNVRYGLIKTRLGQVENLTPTTPSNFRYDTHYPPLFTLLLSIPVVLFGPHEWSIRLLPIIINLLNLYLIFRLGSLLFFPQIGALASILVLFTPIFTYFGKNPVHEPLTFSFILLNTILLYQAVTKPKEPKYISYLLTSSLLALFSGWPAYYHLPLLAIYGFLKTDKKLLLSLLLFPFLGLFIHLLHIRLLTGSFTGGGLVEIILYRLSVTRTNLSDAYTLPQFISRFTLFSRNMFTIPLLITSLLGFLTLKKNRFYLILLATGILHSVVFSNIGYIHDYLQLPFLGFISLTSAFFLSKILPQRYLLPFGTLISLLFLSTKLPFTIAMINSYMSKPEYDLVQQIKNNELGEPQILPRSQAQLLTGVVTPYYLQTQVEYIEGDTDFFQVVRLEDKLIITPYDTN